MSSRSRPIWPGRTHPLGAFFDGAGTNFAVFSSIAEGVELCLFDATGAEERIRLDRGIGQIWTAYLPDVGPGTRYGFRVHGPWDPENGLRCNPFKLLVDPYARAIDGSLQWGPALAGYKDGDSMGAKSEEDSAPYTHRSVVVQPHFDWGTDTRPAIPWNETVIYEAHVKGLTFRHPEVPPHQRGTYAAVAHPAVVQHLKKLGVTAIELLPVHAFVHDGFLLERGQRNYWGYNTLGYFAPHLEYASVRDPNSAVVELKQMVRALHREGIEVILDVVYNHTAEGNHMGPHLSMRGLDNPAYYRLVGDQPGYYMDYTGTGNTLNMLHPNTLQLVMDSLRYWIEEMHVDGFRFDLAAALARGLHEVDRLAAFFDLIQQDPVVSRVKLIAEPWDVGEGGYQLGQFPPGWSEWNGRYRDWIRDYWRGEMGTLNELGTRVTGSSDLYQNSRFPNASINFVAAHDGFTLRDLVSYDEKHNIANGEESGEDNNRSWNCGIEGPTRDADVLRLRTRQQRNFLATLFLSQGVPMLLGGDEMGRTQRGNNNGYCQDSEISWFDWRHRDDALFAYTAKLAALRRAHPVFRRCRWFEGKPIRPGSSHALPDIAWFSLDGVEMEDEHWEEGATRTLQVFLNGDGITETNERGEPITDDTFLVIFHAHPEDREVTLPDGRWGARWRRVLDTERGFPEHGDGEQFPAGATINLIQRCLWVLKRVA